MTLVARKSVSRLCLHGALISSALFLFACASGSSGTDSGDDSGDSGSNSSSTNDDDTSSGPLLRFNSSCGTVVDGVLVNPASSADAELVDVVGVGGTNLVVVRRTQGPVQGNILVKLHGVGAATSRDEAVFANLQSIAQGQAYFIPARTASGTEGGLVDCTVSVNGGTAYTGQLFTLQGESYSELLLSTGASGEIDSGGSCGESNLTTCYTQMREANVERSAGEITDFLWKPAADSQFNSGSPVIHVNPCNATVYVNGQALQDFGPGNGRCNTSRMFSNCGSFGTNIKVEVIDNASGLPYFDGPNPFVIVPNGCTRFEFVR